VSLNGLERRASHSDRIGRDTGWPLTIDSAPGGFGTRQPEQVKELRPPDRTRHRAISKEDASSRVAGVVEARRVVAPVHRPDAGTGRPGLAPLPAPSARSSTTQRRGRAGQADERGDMEASQMVKPTCAWSSRSPRATRPWPQFPRPHPGGLARPDPGGLKSITGVATSFRHICDLVDPPGRHPRRRRQSPLDSHPGPHG
jgi:hypothetical protein